MFNLKHLQIGIPLLLNYSYCQIEIFYEERDCIHGNICWDFVWTVSMDQNLLTLCFGYIITLYKYKIITGFWPILFGRNTAGILWISLNGDLLAFAREAGAGWSVNEDVESLRQWNYYQ